MDSAMDRVMGTTQPGSQMERELSLVGLVEVGVDGVSECPATAEELYAQTKAARGAMTRALSTPTLAYAANSQTAAGRRPGAGGVLPTPAAMPRCASTTRLQMTSTKPTLQHQAQWSAARLSRRACRVFPIAIFAILFLHAVSCGFLFCVHLPIARPGVWSSRQAEDDRGFNARRSRAGSGVSGRGRDDHDHDHDHDHEQQQSTSDSIDRQPPHPNGANNTTAAAADASSSSAAGGGYYDDSSDFSSRSRPPNLIPDVLHQTYRTKALPSNLIALMDTWKKMNPDFSFRFYDDAACLAFVRREFPEYFDAYVALPKSVERSDFFRYMVVLRLGGYYADVDTECRSPLSGLARQTDTLIVGWEGEFHTFEEAEERRFVRQRQVLQWTFAAAPGHPALRDACDRIAEHAREKFSNNTNADTLQKTGPGMWTDVVMLAASHHPSSPRDPWGVRFLPRVSFGAHPKGQDGVSPNSPDVLVQHKFVGSWKAHPFRNPFASKIPSQIKQITKPDSWRAAAAAVSMLWDPPFDAFVFPAGSAAAPRGSPTAVASRSLTMFGRWHLESEAPPRGAGIAEMAVRALESNGGGLVTITPGLGVVALAAAARKHVVTALVPTTNSTPSSELFNHALNRNGFRRDGSVAVVEVRKDSAWLPNVTESKVSAVHLGAVDPSHPGGWEIWGFDAMFRVVEASQPEAVVLEYQPGRASAWAVSIGAKADPSAIFARLHSLGYTTASHTGRVCTAHWVNTTQGLMTRFAASAVSHEDNFVLAPTWCPTELSSWDSLLAVTALSSDAEPETFLFSFPSSAGHATANASSVQ